MNLMVYSPATVPPEVVQFWKETRMAQDRIGYFASSPEWFGMMAAGSGRGMVAVARGDDGRIKAVLPLLPMRWTMKAGLPGLPKKVFHLLKVCGGDLIEAGLTSDELAQIFREIVRQHGEFDGFCFDHLPEGDRARKLKSACTPGSGFFLWTIHKAMPHYRLVLPATREGYRDLRSAVTLKKIHGRERALARAVGGECRIIEIRQEPDWVARGEVIHRLMGKTWQARWLGHELDDTGVQVIARHGWLRSFLLTAGDRPAAFALCYQGMGTLIYEAIGYDQEFAKYSPGILLLHRLLDQLYTEDTPRYVDFGIGEGEYKRQLANDVIAVNGWLILKRKPFLVAQNRIFRTLEHVANAGVRVLDYLGMRTWIRRRIRLGH